MQFKKNKDKILFLAPGPLGISPGQRFRFEHYLVFIDESRYDFHSFYPNFHSWKVLYKPKNTLEKCLILLFGFFRRIVILFTIKNYATIYVFREITPLGPPIFEWLIAKVFKKKIIYDFDDAIWIPAISEDNKIAFKFKCFGKIKKICSYAHIVTVGNNYLANFAKQFCENVIIIPTVVDTQNIHNKIKIHGTNICTIGWTGSFSTLIHLQTILPVLKELQKKIDFNFLAIADKDPHLPIKNYQFIQWNKETETADLLKMDIGIMPLPNDEWSKGKCGFKAIQYMSLGIPAIVSNVGVNATIVDDGINGYVCNTHEEWIEKLAILLTNLSLRNTMGENARIKIENCYSVDATKNMFLQTLDYIS
jgi:glycosyltransferase involved in cell wall biosynthesis